MEKFGHDAWERSLSRLGPADRRVWEQTLMHIGTYDFLAFKALAIAVAQETSGSGEAALAGMYAFIAERSLNSLYKIFFRLANPAFVISNFPKLWSRFFTAGRVEVPSAGAGRAELRFRLPEMFLDWIGPACLGFSTKAVELAGGRAVAVQETERRSVGGGDWELAYAVTWSQGR